VERGGAWVRRLDADLSLQRPRFTLGSVHVGYVVDKVALDHVILRDIRSSPANIIPPWASIPIYHLENEQ
jgi:hypothetical protein